MPTQVPLVALAGTDGTPVTITSGSISTNGGGSSSPINQGALTDRSGTITTGGTAQNAMAANSSRKYLLLRNPLTATEALWFNFTTTAVTASPSLRLDPGDFFIMEGTFISTEAISVIATSTGHAWTAKEG